MLTPRMYVLVRKDLDQTYRCVQGGHAIAAFALQNREAFCTWNNSTLVFLGVNNEIALRQWTETLTR